jgi:ribosomal protein S18 acetylase RimI-like enzyme
MPAIRRAHSGDARKLSEVAEATFRATFDAMNTIEHMELHCRRNYGEQIQAAEISNPEIVTLLGEHEGNLIGYAQLRWGEFPDCVSATRPGEIQRLYIIEDWHGKGVAQKLMNACIEEVKQRGSAAVWLGVWECNPRAISFYKKFGFVAAGEHTFPLGGDPQRDIVMVRAIGSEQST